MRSAHLLERCRSGDSVAIETLVETHRESIYRLTLSLLDDPVEAGAATHEVVITRRLDGQPVVVASNASPSQSRTQLSVLDPRTFEIVDQWSVNSYAAWVSP